MTDVESSQDGNSNDSPQPKPMSFLARVDRWHAEALDALRRYYGTECEAGHMAAIVLALICEREKLIDYIARTNPVHHSQRIH